MLHRLNMLVASALTWKVAREEGQTMTEYALILSLIAVVVAAVLLTFGQDVAKKFTDVSGKL